MQLQLHLHLINSRHSSRLALILECATQFLSPDTKTHVSDRDFGTSFSSSCQICGGRDLAKICGGRRRRTTLLAVDQSSVTLERCTPTRVLLSVRAQRRLEKSTSQQKQQRAPAVLARERSLPLFFFCEKMLKNEGRGAGAAVMG